MNGTTASTWPERLPLKVYINTRHIRFLDQIKDNQAITRSDALRRVIDEAMARVRKGDR